MKTLWGIASYSGCCLVPVVVVWCQTDTRLADEYRSSNTADAIESGWNGIGKIATTQATSAEIGAKMSLQDGDCSWSPPISEKSGGRSIPTPILNFQSGRS